MNSLKTDILPNAKDHEESIISSCIGFPKTAAQIVDELHPDYFYHTGNQIIFQAIKTLHESGEPPDLPTVVARLKVDGNLEQAGGAPRISTLIDIPVPSSIPHYCKQIKDAYLLRKTIETANEISKSCYAGGDVSKIVDDAQQQIMGIHVDGGIESTSFGEMGNGSIDRYEELYRNRGRLSGLPTGFKTLDGYTCGLQDSDLYVLAARPSMGKSALIGAISKSAAAAGYPVGGFSLEMSKNQWFDRSVSGEARVNSNKFRSGFFQDQDWERITSAVSRTERLPIHIDDTGGLHYSEIRSRARKMKKKFGCQMFFIDHLQLTRGDNPSNENMEIKSITGAMKGMAKELNVPVVLLSQLNRKLEDRGNKRPIMSDLRGSGAIEQDADTIMFLYRRAVYNDWDGFEFHGETFSKPPGYNPTKEMQMVFDSDAELSIAKQRNGPTGGMKLLWQSKFANFYDRQPGN